MASSTSGWKDTEALLLELVQQACNTDVQQSLRTGRALRAAQVHLGHCLRLQGNGLAVLRDRLRVCVVQSWQALVGDHCLHY